VTQRNQVIAAEAFLVPYNEIFQFIEDIILVRVNYALGSGNKKLTDMLVHFGYVGALASGVLAAVVGTILGAIPPVLQALTIPGASNDANLYPGCDIISDSTEGILPYWMIELWAMPGTQLGLVLSGFMLGAFELPTVGWLGGISVAMIPIIWFTQSASSPNMVFILGIAEFAAAWCLPVLATLYIIGPLGKDLREHTGVCLEAGKMWNSFKTLLSRKNPDASQHGNEVARDQPEEAKNDEEKELENVEAGVEALENDISQNSRTLLFDGLKIMFMDVAIQFCISLSIYLALANDAADGYKLTALQSALPQYGIAYALGKKRSAVYLCQLAHYPADQLDHHFSNHCDLIDLFSFSIRDGNNV